MSKIISSVIILFWLIMTGLLIKREVIPALPVLANPSYEALLKNKSIPPKSQMGIYMFGKKIGYSLTTVTQQPDGNYRIENRTQIKLPLMKTRIPSEINQSLAMNGHSLVNSDYQLKSFNFSIQSQFFNYQVTGQVKGTDLEVTINDGQTTKTRSVKFQPQSTTSNGLSPFLSMPHLSVGKEWSINLINPFTLKFETVKAFVESQDTMSWQGQEYDVYEVVLDYKGFQPRAWITPEGLILKEEIMMPGFYLIRE